jgi:hypothetical protein
MINASSTLALILLTGALSASAQPAGQPATQTATRPACPNASGGMPRAHGCRGDGPGHHPHADGSDTAGWALMTPKEREAHRQRMASFKSYEECKAYIDHHHEEMAARAKDAGRTMPAQPRRDPCASLEKIRSK